MTPSEFIQKVSYYLKLFQVRLGRYSSLDWDRFNVVFIVSTGRTGTTFLGKKLNEFEQITAKHEPRPTFFQLGVDYARGDASFDEALDTVRRDRRVVLSDVYDEDADYYVESNNRFYCLIPVLRELFPSARFVHIIRDGRDYVRSGYSRNWYMDSDPYDHMKASQFEDDPFHSEWEDFSRFEKICWRWQKKDAYIYEATHDRDDAVILKFEDIFDGEDGYPGMRRLLEFIDSDLEFQPELMGKKIRSTREYELPPKEEWPEERREQFRRIAGDHMIQYGYFDEVSDW